MFLPKMESYSQRLQDLIDISFSQQIDYENSIDWKQSITIPNEINLKTYIDMVSQLYYAEEATISIIAKIINQVPDLQAKQYLCTQAIDEAKHSQVYKKYLNILGDIAPINESLKHVLDEGLSWNGNYCASIIALNVIMEGEAIKQQQKRIETLPCKLFNQINTLIIRDEARHAAFGKIYMKQKLPELCSEEKHKILAWICSLWSHWTASNKGRYSIDGGNILRTADVELEHRWNEQMMTLKNIGLEIHENPIF